MDFYRLRRAVTGLIAAYALALQAVFAAAIPLSSTEGAAASPAFCIGDPAIPADAASNHPCIAICAASAHGLSGAEPAALAFGDWTAEFSGSGYVWRECCGAAPALSGGASPRGPPRA
jgi:hypothetical protein